MRKVTAQKITQKSQIDWEAIRQRILVMKYLPGYKISDAWILTTGFWNDSGEWQDDDYWKD